MMVNEYTDDLGYGDPYRFICTDPACPGECGSDNHPVNAEVYDEKQAAYDQWLMDLADEIGSKIEAGILPPKDENGFYIL